MNATKRFSDIESKKKLTVDTLELQSILGCGRKTAVEIGEAAEAKIRLGKRVFWNIERIHQHIHDISE